MKGIAVFAAAFMLVQKEAQAVIAGKSKSAICISSDAETFKAYHAFIKKVVGSRIIIGGDN